MYERQTDRLGAKRRKEKVYIFPVKPGIAQPQTSIIKNSLWGFRHSSMMQSSPSVWKALGSIPNIIKQYEAWLHKPNYAVTDGYVESIKICSVIYIYLNIYNVNQINILKLFF